MTATLTRRRSLRRPMWRRAAQLQPSHRQRFYASRQGIRLHVTLIALSWDTGRVNADVESLYGATATSWPIADLTNTKNVAATIALAKRWAEMRADEFTEQRGNR